MAARFESAFDRADVIGRWSRRAAEGAPSFFQSPTFIAAWLAAAGDNVRLLDTGEAMAFIGVGEGAAWFGETARAGFDRLYVEYQDFLLAAGAGDSARDNALDALIAGAPEISEFVFRNARPALADACVRAAARNNLEVRILLSQPTFAIDLTREIDMSASLRAKIRRSIRRYEERGTIALTPAVSPDERTAAFAEMRALHEPYWRARGEPGAFADPSLLAFHERFIIEAPQAADLLRLSAGRETIGVLYNFIAGDRVFNYQSGLRAETDNQFAPGFTAHFLAAEHYRLHGYSAYDLMAGEADYKRRLGREGETLTSLVMERRSVMQRVKSLVRRLRRSGMRRT